MHKICDMPDFGLQAPNPSICY